MKKVWRYWDLRDDLLKSLQGGSEEFKKDERVQGLLSHPWTTVYTEDEGERLYSERPLFFRSSHSYVDLSGWYYFGPWIYKGIRRSKESFG